MNGTVAIRAIWGLNKTKETRRGMARSDGDLTSTATLTRSAPTGFYGGVALFLSANPDLVRSLTSPIFVAFFPKGSSSATFQVAASKVTTETKVVVLGAGTSATITLKPKADPPPPPPPPVIIPPAPAPPQFRIVVENLDSAEEQGFDIPLQGNILLESVRLLLGQRFSIKAIQIKADESATLPLTSTLDITKQEVVSQPASEFYDSPKILFDGKVLLRFTDPVPTEFFAIHSGRATIHISFQANANNVSVELPVMIDACGSRCGSTLGGDASKSTFDDLLIHFADLRGIPVEILKAQILHEAGTRPDPNAFRYEPLAIDFKENFIALKPLRLRRQYAPYVLRTLNDTTDSNLPQGSSLKGNGPDANSGPNVTPRRKYRVEVGESNCPLQGVDKTTCPLRALLHLDTSPSRRTLTGKDEFVSMENILFSNEDLGFKNRQGQEAMMGWTTIDPGPRLLKSFMAMRTIDSTLGKTALQPFTGQTVIASSYGLTQMLYSTAVDAVEFKDQNSVGYPPGRLFEPKTSIDLGSEYLARLFRKFVLRYHSIETFSDLNDLKYAFGVALKPYNGGKVSITKLKQGCNLDAGTITKEEQLHKVVQYPCEILIDSQNYAPRSN